MARRNLAQVQFDALSLEGALLPPEWLARVAALQAPAQSAADYAVPKGLQLRDEIGRFWRIAQATWTEFVAARSGVDPVGASNRLTRDLLMHVFGFADLAVVREREISGRAFPLAYEALGGRVPVVVGPFSETLDQNVSRHGDGSRRRSAWGVLQEYLNASDVALWGLTTNGLSLRLGRDNASLTRPAWLEADLERIFDEDRFSDFSVLWLLLHVSRFGRADQQAHEAPLERWREEGRQEGSRARDVLRVGVEEALRALGQGFVGHSANVPLREALASGALAPADYFNELLRLVYRAIFLLTVEERGILHSPDAAPDAVALYASGYGMRRLRERSVRHSAHDRHGDLWESLRPVFSALGRAEGESVLALPGLGGLFAPVQCPHLDGAALENRALLTAVFRLAWLREGGSLARVNWKDMGVEEFGSVYESLLELVPVVSDGGRRFSFAGEGESAGNARKLSGSYYTPDALVQQLLDTALEPVVEATLSPHANPTEAECALLSLAVIDPACGSGHFLLAAARRIAGHLARLRAGGTPGAVEYRHALRDVVTHCIHGVDRNPMALELARMALWLEAYTPDRALGFLDHHLVCGDALLGLMDLSAVKNGIPDEAFKPLAGDNQDVAKLLTKLNRAGRKALEKRISKEQLPLSFGDQSLANAFAELDALADHGIAGVEAKRARYAALRSETENSPIAMAADLFVGAFLMPKQLTTGERALTEHQAAGRFPTTGTLAMAIDGSLGASHPAAAAARSACSLARVLHWPLAFPQVFANGGFDVVLGNPPWEMVELSEKEYFATRASEIASATSAAARSRMIAELESSNPLLFSAFIAAKRTVEATRMIIQKGGRFPLSSNGRINLYPVFVEAASIIVSSRGLVGLVVPSAIAMDAYNVPLFRSLAESGRLLSLFDFENRAPLFEEVHRSYRFCLLTLGGERASSGRFVFAFSCASVSELLVPGRRYELTSADLSNFSPSSFAPPVFVTSEDLAIARKCYSLTGVFVDRNRDVNRWSASIQRMLSLSDPGDLFMRVEAVVALDDGERDEWVRLYSGKVIHQFNHRFATYESGHWRNVTNDELADSAFSLRTEYYARASEVERRLADKGVAGWLLGFRDIARATDERTMIATVIPPVGCDSHCRNIYVKDVPAVMQACLLANLNCMVFDFLIRQKTVGTQINASTLEQCPVLPPSTYGAQGAAWVAARVLELTYNANDLTVWARQLGHEGPPFRWDPDRRASLRADLDAWFALAYGLTRDELRYVLDPSDVMGSGWPTESFRVLKQSEVRQFGEYRTRRMVLSAYDALSTQPIAVTPSVPFILQSPLPAQPEMDQTAELALVIFALVREAGDALAVTELTRALVLRSAPNILTAFAPPELAEHASAWSAQATAAALRPGAIQQTLLELVNRQGLRWVTDGAERSVATTEHTPPISHIHDRFRYESALALSVLRAMPAFEIGQLDQRSGEEGGASGTVRSA